MRNFMSIEWINLKDETPPADVEILAFNPDRGSRKLSNIYRFGKNFTEEKILDIIKGDNYTLWTIVS